MSINCLNLRGQKNASPLKNPLVLSHIEVRRVYVSILREFFPPKLAKYARLLIMLNGYLYLST